MKQYVCGFMRDEYNIALVRKNKPAWQAGKLNGIGGGMEFKESPIQAMRREWFEETYTQYHDWQFFAELRFDEAAVHFFKAVVEKIPALPFYNDIGERLEVHNYEAAVRFTDMIPNLKWLLPLAFEDPDAGWTRSTPWLHKKVAANDNALPATQVAA